MVRLQNRQVPPPENAGYPACNLVSNAVLSCYPNSSTTVSSPSSYSKFIWNANFPTFIGAGYVDALLFNADTQVLSHNYSHLPNPQGSIGISPSDGWFNGVQAQETLYQGQNRTWRFYFVVVTAGASLTGAEPHQATFRAIETGSVRLPQSSSSNSLSSDPSSSLSSSSRSSSPQSPSSTLIDGVLQPINPDSSGPPAWIAAPIVVGSLLLLAILAALIFLLCKRRRSRSHQYSKTPPEDASLAGAAVLPSDKSSKQTPISSSDAAVMASAFRDILRRPQFGQPPDSDESIKKKEHLHMQKELADDGRAVQDGPGKKINIIDSEPVPMPPSS